jgi:O-antigen/teichoic acid export membrane protein
MLFTLDSGVRGDRALVAVGTAYVISGFGLLFARVVQASRILPRGMDPLQLEPWAQAGTLLAAGSFIALAQLADFLYAPTDYILINRLISPGTVAYYAPAVQIDAGLFVVVGALAAVLLPKAALAHTSGDVATLRTYYVRGTLLSAALLVAASLAVYFLSPWIFRLWLGNPMPQTQAILPLVLIHTVVGGSAGVGRSILLGMGKVKPFAAAALVAGVANVVLSFVFVKYFALGLNGIVYGTLAAVIGRCVLWQPWFVLRTLQREAATPQAEPAVPVPPQPL